MKYTILILCIVVFMLGWFTADVYSVISADDLELPYQVSGSEKASPGNWVAEEQILVYKDRVVIKIENASWSRYADSNSMDPLLDKGANGLELVPEKAENLEVGDIIAYNADWVEGVVIHRIVNLSEDEEGWYATAKGDNNGFSDPQKIRFSDIKYVLVGLIY